MGVVFWAFGNMAGFMSLVLLALAISSGLYMLAELAEEFPTLAGRIARYIIGFAVIMHIVLWMDGLPWVECCVGLLAHLVYATMMRNFPYVELLSVSSVGSAVSFVISNLMWLRLFVNNPEDPFRVIGFFIVIVWAAPCCLFVSLTISDGVLPSSASQCLPSSGSGSNLNSVGTAEAARLASGKQKSVLRSIVDSSMDSVEGATNWNGFRLWRFLSEKRR